MRGLRLVPIVVGVAVAGAGSIIAGVGYFLARFAVELLESFSSGHMEAFGTIDILVVGLITLLFVILGGYVAARLGKMRHVAYGVAVGATVFAIGLLLALPEVFDSGLNWFALLSQVVVVPAGAAAGHLAGHRKYR